MKITALTDLPTSQPEPDQLGGSDFMDWMAGRLANPEVLAGYLAAHEREVREQVAREIEAVAERIIHAQIEANRHIPDIIARLLDGYSQAAHIARQEQP